MNEITSNQFINLQNYNVTIEDLNLFILWGTITEKFKVMTYLSKKNYKAASKIILDVSNYYKN